MKVLMLNGSPRVNGNTHLALLEMKKVFEDNGVEVDLIQVGNRAIRGCMACGGCRKIGKCVFDDDIVNEIIEKAKKADGFVFGSPVYYAHPSGRLLSVLNRAFLPANSFE